MRVLIIFTCMKKLENFLLAIVCTLSACAQQPPKEEGEFRTNDLVEIVLVDSTIKLDIRYATTNNFAGTKVYEEARAFLQRPAAVALAEVNKELRQLGYGLMVFDGYRPWSVTKYFWDITPENQKAYVADPKKGSVHNRGCAVDLTLYNLATGEQVDMPSGYDEMNEKAHPDYAGGTDVQRANRDLLISKMQAHGFTVYPVEWWHFDYKDTRHYRITDVPFGALE